MRSGLLITGANGFLGSACLARFATDPNRDVVAVWHTGRERIPADPTERVRLERCDLSDYSQVESLFAKRTVHQVVHTAALLPDGAPGYLTRATEANVLATANLVQAAASHGVKRFVYCSSISVYGDSPRLDGGWSESSAIVPSSVYGWSKYAGEECLRVACSADGLNGVSLRLAGIHGPGRSSGAVFHMLRSALSSSDIAVSDPAVPFQLLFLDDAVAAVAHALDVVQAAPHQTINVASHTFATLLGMAEEIVALCASRSAIRSGAAGTSEPQLMNVQAMASRLGMTPRYRPDQLEETRRWVELRERAR